MQKADANLVHPSPDLYEGGAVELVVFDCDGVLIDSEIIACEVEAEELSKIGYKVSCADVAERFVGMPSNKVYEVVERELGHALPQGFESRLYKKILERYRTDLREIGGANEVISLLDTKKCVASSSEPAKLALGLIEAGLFELLYPFIYSTTLVARGKPHPDLFEYSAKSMGVSASECLVVEDSVAGVTAARAAGMRVVGFYGGSHCSPLHSEKLYAAGACAVISDLRAILQVVTTSASST